MRWCIDELCRTKANLNLHVCADINNETEEYSSGTVNLNMQRNYVCLNGLVNDVLEHRNLVASEVSHMLKQGGDAWLELRN